jgi:serralysin
VVGTAYTGPVVGILNEYINITPNNLNISAATPGWFIRTGAGNDAILVTSGANVLDGGTGSNFLSGGSGADTFFVDNRGAVVDTWNTLANFGVGDTATLWGVTPADFRFDYENNGGAAGYTGVTIHAVAAGRPVASLTFSGQSMSDFNSGRISMTSGIDSASGSSYTAFVRNT